jgi:hypothetical protein
VYPKGGVDVGEWRNGMEDGGGAYTWATGQKYEGRWREGKRDGWDVQTHVGGDRYVGFRQNDVRAGQSVCASRVARSTKEGYELTAL